MVFKSRTVILLIVFALLLGGAAVYTADTWSTLIFAKQGVTEAPYISDHEDEEPVLLWESSGLTSEQMNKFASVFYLINDKFYKEVNSKEVFEGAITGMLSSLEDPYSEYMDREEVEKFTETIIDSSFSGIGAEVTMEDGRVTVVSPIKDSPAERAGIHARDKILSVNGKSLDGLTLNESVMQIRGPKGTQAKLEILRPGSPESVEITVVRDDIDVETIFSSMLDDQLGKIEIRRFAQNTAEHFIEEIENLERQGMKALIIDVRNNPGGILPVVSEMAGALMPEGKTIVQTEERDGTIIKEVSEGTGKSYPIVVLINQGSASASEILAAALRESAGATVIGQTTFGKGTVQTAFQTSEQDGSNIKLTISKWLTPNGNSINEVGVEPDMIMDQPEFFMAIPIPRDTILKYDMVSNDVKNLQIMLKGVGFMPDRTDGYFSKGTEEAVRKFQLQYELEATGEVEELTREKLEQEIVNEIRKEENDLQLAKAKKVLKEQLKY